MGHHCPTRGLSDSTPTGPEVATRQRSAAESPKKEVSLVARGPVLACCWIVGLQVSCVCLENDKRVLIGGCVPSVGVNRVAHPSRAEGWAGGKKCGITLKRTPRAAATLSGDDNTSYKVPRYHIRAESTRSNRCAGFERRASGCQRGRITGHSPQRPPRAARQTRQHVLSQGNHGAQGVIKLCSGYEPKPAARDQCIEPVWEGYRTVVSTAR
jgi:hypothetical protein